jgi:hypothetical protein
MGELDGLTQAGGEIQLESLVSELSAKKSPSRFSFSVPPCLCVKTSGLTSVLLRVPRVESPSRYSPYSFQRSLTFARMSSLMRSRGGNSRTGWPFASSPGSFGVASNATRRPHTLRFRSRSGA